MPRTMTSTLPLSLPERADRMAKGGFRAVRKADHRAALGQVLYNALLILRIPRLKQQAALLQRDPRQVARWFNGEDPIPWEEVLSIRDLQWPLAQALLESCQQDLVEVRTIITRRGEPVSQHFVSETEGL